MPGHQPDDTVEAHAGSSTEYLWDNRIARSGFSNTCHCGTYELNCPFKLEKTVKTYIFCRLYPQNIYVVLLFRYKCPDSSCVPYRQVKKILRNLLHIVQRYSVLLPACEQYCNTGLDRAISIESSAMAGVRKSGTCDSIARPVPPVGSPAYGADSHISVKHRQEFIKSLLAGEIPLLYNLYHRKRGII